MVLLLHPSLKPHQQKAAWHVLASTSEVFVGRPRSDGEVGIESLRICRPVVPVMATSSACLADGLFDTGTVSGFTEAAAGFFKTVGPCKKKHLLMYLPEVVLVLGLWLDGWRARAMVFECLT